jgi:hypothetical protein
MGPEEPIMLDLAKSQFTAGADDPSEERKFISVLATAI